MSELGRIFFQNSNLTVNLTPALIALAVLLLGEIDEAFTSLQIYDIYIICHFPSFYLPWTRRPPLVLLQVLWKVNFFFVSVFWGEGHLKMEPLCFFSRLLEKPTN